MLKDLSVSIDVNHRTNKGETILHYCCLGKSVIVMNCLLSIGASPNIKNKRNNTPLQTAILRNQVLLVEVLLKNGAEIDQHTIALANRTGTHVLIKQQLK